MIRHLSRAGMLFGVLLLTITSGMAAIQVEVNGRALSFAVPPTSIGGRTMVPLRGIFESLGAQVNWNANTSTITATKGDTDVRLSIGDPRATVNGETVLLDAPAVILNGATMVPVRFVSEALGADVKWFEATQTVSITTGVLVTPAQVTEPAQQDQTMDSQGRQDRLAARQARELAQREQTMESQRRLDRIEAQQALEQVQREQVQRDQATESQRRQDRLEAQQARARDQRDQTMVIPQGTVIPVRLDRTLSSATDLQDGPVTVTVRSDTNGDAEFPRGTKIDGVVLAAQRAGDGQPGMLDLSFREVRLPNGDRVQAEGSLISLDEKMVMQTSDGRLVVRNQTSNDRLKFIGLGAAGGLILGRLTKHTLEGTLLGAAAGYLYSEYDRNQVHATDVTVAEGTEFGVRLDRPLTYHPSRAFLAARADYLQASPSSVRLATRDIGVTTAGRHVSFPNAQPFEEGGIVLVPLAPVMGEAGVGYNYNERLQTVRVNTHEGELTLKIGSSYALLNGERENLEAPAQVRNGVVFVPLHFLALATGTRVVWVSKTRTVAMHVPS